MAGGARASGGMRFHRGQPSWIFVARRGRVVAGRFAASGGGDSSVSQAAGQGRSGSSRGDAALAGGSSSECLRDRDSGGGRAGQAAGAMAGSAGGGLCAEAWTVSREVMQSVDCGIASGVEDATKLPTSARPQLRPYRRGLQSISPYEEKERPQTPGERSHPRLPGQTS